MIPFDESNGCENENSMTQLPSGFERGGRMWKDV